MRRTCGERTACQWPPAAVACGSGRVDHEGALSPDDAGDQVTKGGTAGRATTGSEPASLAISPGGCERTLGMALASTRGTALGRLQGARSSTERDLARPSRLSAGLSGTRYAANAAPYFAGYWGEIHHDPPSVGWRTPYPSECLAKGAAPIVKLRYDA